MTNKTLLLKLLEECFWIDSDGHLQFNYKEEVNLGVELGEELNQELKEVIRKFKLRSADYEPKPKCNKTN